MSGPVRYCGRDFPEAALERIRALLARRRPRLSRTALSRAVCEALDWRKPDGGLKDMSARVALLRMERDGLLTLPPPWQPRSRPRPPRPSPRTDPPSRASRPVSLAAARPLRLSALRPRDPRSRLWNDLAVNPFFQIFFRAPVSRWQPCAVERRFLSVGAKPTQQLSLRLVAARAVHGGNEMG